MALFALAVPSAHVSAQEQSGAGAPGKGTPPPTVGQETPAPATAANIGKFLAGGALGLAAHEGGHLALDYGFNASPGIRRVDFGPIPFFAITHTRLTPRREFLVASAGFWVQHVGNEILLSSRPRLRDERAPMAKGFFAFNVLASVAYAGGAMAHAGPVERDTRAMAAFLDVDEAVVGTMLLVPALLDTVRYYRPESRWPVWASRAAKVALMALALRGGK